MKKELFLFLFVVLAINSHLWGFSGGDGSVGNPYQIFTAADLAYLSEQSSIWDNHFVLTSNLDMTDYSVNPIGNSDAQFIGSFDGQGLEIRNLSMDFPEKPNVGLFGIIGENGLVTNVTVVDCQMNGKTFIGIICAYNSKGSISDCNTLGRLSTTKASYCGGITGISVGGKILRCHSQVDIIADSATSGGITGYNMALNTISESSADIWIIASDPNSYGSTSGGIAGANSGNISKCSASGTIFTTSENGNDMITGGIVGDNKGTISKSETTTHIYVTSSSSSALTGGLAGINNGGNIESVSSKGNITSSLTPETVEFSGGLTGLNYEGLVSYSYSKGIILSGNSATALGGLAGMNLAGDIYSSFWDTSTSGLEISAGGIGLSTDKLKSMSTYQNAGWYTKGWLLDDGKDYPTHSWQGGDGIAILNEDPLPFSNLGTPEDPYQIWNADDFLLWQQYSSALHDNTILMADIDLAGIAINPIGDHGPFIGFFDGNRHTISNAVIEQTNNSFVGFFRIIGEGGIVKDLHLENIQIKGLDYTAGLVAKNIGTILRCSVEGEIASTGNFCGAMTGENYGGTIRQSSTNAHITSTSQYVGGFTGQNIRYLLNDLYIPGIITNCYSLSKVTAKDYTGGFAGYIGYDSQISYCYTAGDINSEGLAGGFCADSYEQSENCFWDSDISGLTADDGSGALPKTNEQFRQSATFSNSGWDYNLNWKQIEGSYPVLQWQAFVSDLNRDGIINNADLVLLAENWLTEDENLPLNIDNKGRVDMVDYAILSREYKGQ